MKERYVSRRQKNVNVILLRGIVKRKIRCCLINVFVCQLVGGREDDGAHGGALAWTRQKKAEGS